MGRHQLKKAIKEVALSNGGDLVGVVRVADLPEHEESISRMLLSARSVVVIAVRHSLTALSSANNQLAQLDTAHTYEQAARAALITSRFLESKGFRAAAVPAFLPLDMADPKKGMRGEICWRRTGVRAGLGSYGENGLLVTKEFGAAIRLSGLVTSAELEPDSPLEEDLCNHCMACVDACPGKALSGEGKINKKACGNTIFKYGFRFFQQFMEGLARGPSEQVMESIKGYDLRELWQTFVTGSYYYCFECQSRCPATELPQPPR